MILAYVSLSALHLHTQTTLRFFLLFFCFPSFVCFWYSFRCGYLLGVWACESDHSNCDNNAWVHGHVLVRRRIRRLIQIGILVSSILSHNDSLVFLAFDCPSDAARQQISVSLATNERSFAIHAFSFCCHFCGVSVLSRTSFIFESLDENQSNRELRSTHIELT